MKKKTILTTIAVFALGCVSAPFIVPQLSAQQAAVGVQRWEHHCLAVRSMEAGTTVGMEMGAQGWEMVSFANGGVCFKRPL